MTMKIDFADIVLLNAELKKRNTRYHVTYKDENTACIEPPGDRQKGVRVHFSEDELYFTCDK